jgi:hypothetical protein
MPPRYAYWTILIDQKPTAFRAKDREELQPTFAQLQRKNTDVVMKWFARGRLWDSPEQAQWSDRNMPKPSEHRGSEWRPGGTHEDPRARFKRKKGEKKRPWRPKGDWKPRDGQSSDSGSTDAPPPPNAERPLEALRPLPTAERPEGKRPWTPRADGDRKPWKPKGEWKPREGGSSGRGPRPKPQGARSDWKPREERSSGSRSSGGYRPPPTAHRPAEGDRPLPTSDRPQAKRQWTPRPDGDRKPWKPKGAWKPREGGSSGQGPRPKPQGPRSDWKPRPDGDRKPWKPKGEWKPREGGSSGQGPRPRAQGPRSDWKPRGPKKPK